MGYRKKPISTDGLCREPLGGRQLQVYREAMIAIGADPKAPFATLKRLAEAGNLRAITWLGWRRHSGATSLLGRVLENAVLGTGVSRYEIISRSCEALGNIDTPLGHSILVSHYQGDGDVIERGQALEGLGYEKENSDPKLIVGALRTEREAKMRIPALWAVFEQGKLKIYKPYEKAVLDRLSDIDPEVRALAFHIVGHWGKPRDLTIIANHFNDSAHSRVFHKTIGGLAIDAHEEISKRFELASPDVQPSNL